MIHNRKSGTGFNFENLSSGQAHLLYAGGAFIIISFIFRCRSSHCIPDALLRRARDHKSVCLQKLLPAPGFMGLRPKPHSAWEFLI